MSTLCETYFYLCNAAFSGILVCKPLSAVQISVNHAILFKVIHIVCGWHSVQEQVKVSRSQAGSPSLCWLAHYSTPALT